MAGPDGGCAWGDVNGPAQMVAAHSFARKKKNEKTINGPARLEGGRANCVRVGGTTRRERGIGRYRESHLLHCPNSSH